MGVSISISDLLDLDNLDSEGLMYNYFNNLGWDVEVRSDSLRITSAPYTLLRMFLFGLDITLRQVKDNFSYDTTWCDSFDTKYCLSCDNGHCVLLIRDG